MSYYKNTTAKALEVARLSKEEKQKLWDECAEFCAQFGGKPIIQTSFTTWYFGGISFGDSEPENPHLWTIPNQKAHGLCRPRQKVLPSMKEESKQLLDKWALRPKTRFDSKDIYEAVGLKVGDLFFTSCRLILHDDAIYIETDAIPDNESGTVEILGSEFKAATEQVRREAA